MPRRVLLVLACAVLALHLLVIRHLPLGGTAASDKPQQQQLAFQTRMVEPPAPEPAAVAEPAPAPPPPPRPKPRHRPAPKPAPAPPPAEVPAPEPEPTPADAATAPTAPAAMPAPEPAATADAASAPPAPDDAAAPADSAAAAAAAATAPQQDASAAIDQAPAPASTASAPASAPLTTASSAPAANAPAPTAPATTDTQAGVTIQSPGSGTPPVDASAAPVRLPPSTRLSFDVTGQAKRFHYSASAELLWRNLGATYEARQEIKAFLLGSRSQTSTGRITEQGLQPVRFGDRARAEQAAHFDYDRHLATFSANTPDSPIGPGAQDRLSVFIQLGALLAAAPERYPPGTRITLTTVGARSADRWSFTVEGTETLDLPAGPTPALKLQRLPRADKDRDQQADLWLGTGLGYLPVRIRITQANGDFADLALSGHETP